MRKSGRCAILLLTSALFAATSVVDSHVHAFAVTDQNTGDITSVTYTPGKAQGSNKWGIIGDIDTKNDASGRVYNYGLAISPLDGSVWIADSGHYTTADSTGCKSPVQGNYCQFGEPRVLKYSIKGDDTAGDYKANGTYNLGTARADSLGENYGFGKKFQSIEERTVITEPFTDPIHSGPRGIAFTDDGVAWVANADNSSEGKAVVRIDKDGKMLAGNGSNPQNGDIFPGFHVGLTRASDNTIYAGAGSALYHYSADNTYLGKMDLNLATPCNGTDAAGTCRNSYGLAADPVDGSVYVGLTNVQGEMFLEKRDQNGKVLAQIGKGLMGSSPEATTVYGASVNPVTRNVFTWTNLGTAYEFTKDGEFVRKLEAGTEPGQFPGLTYVRGIAFDKGGRMFITVGGSHTTATAEARILIMGVTPDAFSKDQLCGERAVDKTTVTLNFACGGTVNETLAYGGLPVKDYVVEQSEDDGATWTVVQHDASIEKTRQITGLNPAKNYRFRVSAWNEAGNGNWSEINVTEAEKITAQNIIETTDEGVAKELDVLAKIPAEQIAKRPTEVKMLDITSGTKVAVNKLSVAGEGTYEVVNNKVIFTPENGYKGKATTAKYVVVWGTYESEASIDIEVLGKPAPPVTLPTPPVTLPTPPTTLPTPPSTLPAPPSTLPAPPATLPAPPTMLPVPPATVTPVTPSVPAGPENPSIPVAPQVSPVSTVPSASTDSLKPEKVPANPELPVVQEVAKSENELASTGVELPATALYLLASVSLAGASALLLRRRKR